MVVAHEAERQISSVLTWDEICRRYPDEWVCLVEIEYGRPNDSEIVCARVIGGGTTKREPIQQAKVWWDSYSTIGHFYTGTLRAPPPLIRVVVVDDEA